MNRRPPRFTESIHDQVAYNTLCDALGQWLRREIEALRFEKSH